MPRLDNLDKDFYLDVGCTMGLCFDSNLASVSEYFQIQLQFMFELSSFSMRCTEQEAPHWARSHCY